MTIARLLAALAARVQADMARLWRLPTPSGGHRVPLVHLAWLPPARSVPETADPPDNPGAASDVFPFVLVRPANGSDDSDAATVMVALIIGTYSDDDEGIADAIAVIDVLRQVLEERPLLAVRTGGTDRRDPHGAFEGYAELRLPLAWHVYEEQPRPHWTAVVTTTWTIPRPTRVDAEELTR